MVSLLKTTALKKIIDDGQQIFIHMKQTKLTRKSQQLHMDGLILNN